MLEYLLGLAGSKSLQGAGFARRLTWTSARSSDQADVDDPVLKAGQVVYSPS